MIESKFADLSLDQLPLKITVHRVDNDEEVWRAEVTELPTSLRIPPVANEVGCPVWVRVEYGDGQVHVERPEEQ